MSKERGGVSGVDAKNFSKRILVTGGAGFIGSNFLNLIVPRYPEEFFANVDTLTYAADRRNITVEGAANYHFAQADIRDQEKMAQIFSTYTPTHIIHFAAESHVDNSIAGPRVFVETNVLGTQTLLELARQNGVKRFLYISTDEVYGSLAPEDPPRIETDPLLPNSPYSATKSGGELLVRAYHETFGLDTIITRASNNYGKHQHPEKLIPRFVTNLLNGKNVPLYGTGKNIRDWIAVEDHCEGVDAAFRKGRSGEIYNLGGGNEIENVDITKMLIRLAGRDESAIEYVTDRLGHDMRYALDSGKALRELGWAPKKDFHTQLIEVFEHYRVTLSKDRSSG